MTAFRTAQPPEITFGRVRQALDQLVYTTTAPPASPLIDLALVDAWLESTAGWQGVETRQWALRCVLIDRICHQLEQLRQSWGYIPDRGKTRTAVWEAIQADARTASPEIIGWSWLYYHYVRVEWTLGPGEYSQGAGIDVRTLRRYQNHAIQRLTQQLIQAELDLRQTHQERHLRAALPAAVPPRLFGREREYTWLLRPRQPQHVQISGPAGCGKTSLIEAVLHQEIANRRYDRVIWLKAPRSLAQLRAALRPPYERLALVVDEGEALHGAVEQLTALLAELGESSVYLIHPTYLPLGTETAHLALSGLAYPAMVAWVEAVRQRHLSESVFMPDGETLNQLWQASAGNPAELQRQLYALWYAA